MNRLACWLTVVLGLILLGPVLALLAYGVSVDAGASIWHERGRIITLAENSLLLAAGAVLVSLPFGLIVAIVLERVPFPGRSWLQRLVLIGLVIPLPVLAIGWQVILGAWLPSWTMNPGDVIWRPWAEGLFPAAWVHGMAGFPWVVWIAGAVFRTSDRATEEIALIEGGLRVLILRVWIPRLMLAVVAAGGWVAVITWTEIAVTDAMMVRTFAEEVYTQFVSGTSGVSEAVTVTVPAWLMTLLLAGVVFSRFATVLIHPPADLAPPLAWPGSRTVRRLLILTAALIVLGVIGLPLLALVWKASGGGSPGGPSKSFFLGELSKVIASDGRILLSSVVTAMSVAGLTVVLAWITCWWADAVRFVRVGLATGAIILLITPGPLLGIGLKQVINVAMDSEESLLELLGLRPEFPPLRSLLYEQPSPIPAAWAMMIRMFPVAVVMIWPSLRLIPQELLDAAKLDGLSFAGTWRLVILPLTGTAAMRALVAITALNLGELSASKLVNPPARTIFIHRIFDQMHYGADSTVAALCLMQVGVLIVLAELIPDRYRSETAESMLASNA